MPVLPVLPANNPFRINGRLLERYLDTVEVRSSSLLVPTISFNGLAASSLKTSTHNPAHIFTVLLPIACRWPSGTGLARPVFRRRLPACRDRASSEFSNDAGCPGRSLPAPWPY